MTTKQKLKHLLDDSGRGTKTRLAKHLGISPVYITRYAEDIYDDVSLPSKLFKKTAEFFGIDPLYFLDAKSDKLPVKKIKIVGTASCGGADINHYQSSGSATYNGDFYTDKLYCVVANGDSMSPEIEDGDEIICDPEIKVQNGDMVHYTIGDESAIKIFVKDEDAYIVQFVPYNQTEIFKTRTIRLDDDIEVKIAKVVAVNKLKFNNRHARLKMIGRA